MLDTLAEAWAACQRGREHLGDKTVKFLDPFTKSGVFLREITSGWSKGSKTRSRTSMSGWTTS